MAPKGIKVHVISGAHLTDQVFTITLKTGEIVTWNVTKLKEAVDRGEFDPVRYAATADLPPAEWSSWGAKDRATVDYLKTDPRLLAEPAIAIASPIPEYAILCFADGQHRVTARQELGLAEVGFYIVPLEREREFRVEGLPS